ncbi:hypothetical protein GALMADRAFT_78157 [Galerina marginata CBS 339.88]|uniref:Anaphase-promoting complex subunit 11 n=1 Tax=Galerina marginata (strain CBS 339.88) TaxID=685588 RepID=A0A067SD01_GALM3|nr:hypothetical protein GALMADRAFT_78157 [Galerina marginata CBS 339.88]
MKVNVKQWNAVAQWRWDTGNVEQDDDGEGDVCGICRVPYEGCCPSCKMPGEDCPLIWGQCTHVFHMHCLLKWIGTATSKQQCPMDRKAWGELFAYVSTVYVNCRLVTAERKVGTTHPS